MVTGYAVRIAAMMNVILMMSVRVRFVLVVRI
jgi:hypothetical protein